MTGQSTSATFENDRKEFLAERLKAELEFIRDRRREKKKPKPGERKIDAPEVSEDLINAAARQIQQGSLQFPDIGQSSLDLVGLALSGGGLRSASICLGALQGLNSAGVLDRVDYISTVSGGGYMGGAYVASSNLSGGFCFDSGQGSAKDGEPVNVGDTPEVQHLRDHSKFLAPRGLGDLLQDIAIVVRGLVTSAFVIAPYVVLAATATVLIYRLAGNTIGVGMVDLAPCLTINWLYLAPGVAALLVFWSISRNFTEKSEFADRWASLFGWLLILQLVLLFLQFQDWVLQNMLRTTLYGPSKGATEDGHFLDLLNSALVSSPVLAILIAFFRNQLLEFAKSQSTRLRDMVARQGSRLLLLVGAMILPLLLWLVYLKLVYQGLLGVLDFEKVAFNLPIFGHSIDSTATLAFGALVAGAAAELIGANTYSLHSLYRDRLRQAFLNLYSKEAPGGAAELKMDELTRTAHPYPIFNTALNVQGSTEVNRRGRNADFFSFTPHYSGSPSSGYCKTKTFLDEDKDASRDKGTGETKGIDLATVMAISGAAAAANMGVNSNRPMAFTLAALNIRLGYWAPNPTRSAKLKGLSGYYLWNEMTSALTEKQPKVLLTDGGHVENLAIYELLRRRCRVIVAVDAEADGDLTFGSFYQLERFARIDLGARITIDLEPIARETRARMAANASGDNMAERRKGPHVALGTIHYDGGDARNEETKTENGNAGDQRRTGYLLYIKSSLTGDEADYVRDYARRNPTFPHETTADLFYSEEQFEAYRALGFHMVRRALCNLDEVVLPGRDGGSYLGTLKGHKADSVPAQVLHILGLSDALPKQGPRQKSKPRALDGGV